MRVTGLKHKVSLKVNNRDYMAEVGSHETLLDVLRNKLGLLGTKKGCDTGECGACTVLINNEAFNSCLILAVDARDKEIITIEGLSSSNERLDPLQDAFVQYGAIQCGYCSPGMILSIKALLTSNSNPSEEEIRKTISGNLCRCGCYPKIIEAVKSLCNNG